MALVDTFGARARRQLLGSVPVTVGLVILGALIAVCALAYWIAPYNPTRAVGGINEPPSLAHLFGTTGQGQDVLSQFLYGGQNTLWVAFTIADEIFFAFDAENTHRLILVALLASLVTMHVIDDGERPRPVANVPPVA